MNLLQLGVAPRGVVPLQDLPANGRAVGADNGAPESFELGLPGIRLCKACPQPAVYYVGNAHLKATAQRRHSASSSCGDMRSTCSTSSGRSCRVFI